MPANAIANFFKNASKFIMQGVVLTVQNIARNSTYNFGIIQYLANSSPSPPEPGEEQSSSHEGRLPQVRIRLSACHCCSFMAIVMAGFGTAMLLVSRVQIHKAVDFQAAAPITTPASLPPAILIYGRDEPIQEMVNKILSQPSTVRKHVSIRGPPGMGKTTDAIGIMHDPRIIKHFGYARHWVECQKASNVTDEMKAGKLLEYISESFGIDLTGSSDPRKNIKYFLDNHDVPRILVLDNFETMWEPFDAQEEVERIILFLAQFPRLTMIITTRNGHNPATQRGVRWHRLQPIGPLSPDASWTLFRSLSSNECGDTECLDNLLDEIDHVPLAIVLMASFGQENYTTCQILEMWRNRLKISEQNHTRNRQDGSDPFNKLDNSIALSLEGPLLTSTPHAAVLLRIIASLPVGMRWKNLQKIVPLIPGADRVAEVLIRASLLMNSPDVLTMHSTVRHFMLRNYPLDPSHEEGVQKFYYCLIYNAGGDPGFPNFLDRAEALSHDDTNAQMVLLDGLSRKFTTWAPVSLDYSNYLIWNIPSLEIPEITLGLINDNWRSSKSETECAAVPRRAWYSLRLPFDISRRQLREEVKGAHTQSISTHHHTKSEVFRPLALLRIGALYFRRDEYLDAVKALEKAADLSLTLNHPELAANAKFLLGEISRLQGRNALARELYLVARKLYEDAGDPQGISSCLRAIGIVYSSDNCTSDALEILDLAKETCPNDDHTCLADYEREMGRVLRDTNQTESIRLSEKARKYYLEYGPRRHAAIALYQKAIAQYMMSDYNGAETGLNEAFEEFRSIRNDAQMGYCVYHLGEMNVQRGSLPQALELFRRSEGMFRLMENSYMAGLSLKKQGDIHARLYQPDKARSLTVEANLLLKDVDAKEGILVDVNGIDTDGMGELKIWWSMSSWFRVAGLVYASVLAITVYVRHSRRDRVR